MIYTTLKNMQTTQKTHIYQGKVVCKRQKLCNNIVEASWCQHSPLAPVQTDDKLEAMQQ